MTMKVSAVLAHDEILKLLEDGELFQPNSWDQANLRAAAYDLRIASDLMIVPDDPKHPSGRRYKRGEHRKLPVILKPGEVAFFSTAERLCVPWHVSANIGIKFGYARRGILVLTGLLVDPGFGMKRSGDSWVPKQDERLHFVVANVGSNEMVMVPGKEKLASIQFFHVSGNPLQKEVPSTEDMEHEFFDDATEPKLGLSFFKDTADLRTQFEDFRDRFEAVESGSKQIVMFGVYLLTATILVAALVALLSIVSSADLTLRLVRIRELWPKTWKGVTGLIGAGLVAALVIDRLRKLVEQLASISFKKAWLRSSRSH